MFVLHHFYGLPGNENLPALFAVQDLTIPAPCIEQRQEEVLKKRIFVATGSEQARVLAEYVGAVKTGDSAEHVVHAADCSGRVCHEETDFGGAGVDKGALDRNGGGLDGWLKQPDDFPFAVFLRNLHGQQIKRTQVGAQDGLTEFEPALFYAAEAPAMHKFGDHGAKPIFYALRQQFVDRVAYQCAAHQPQRGARLRALVHHDPLQIGCDIDLACADQGGGQQVIGRHFAPHGFQKHLVVLLQLALLFHQLLQVLCIAKQLALQRLDAQVHRRKGQGAVAHFKCSRTHATTCSGLKGLMK